MAKIPSKAQTLFYSLSLTCAFLMVSPLSHSCVRRRRRVRVRRQRRRRAEGAAACPVRVGARSLWWRAVAAARPVRVGANLRGAAAPICAGRRRRRDVQPRRHPLVEVEGGGGADLRGRGAAAASCGGGDGKLWGGGGGGLIGSGAAPI
uniref:Uncharacterized protein n=1 Tax=Oryza sativa subsp. japonica TaxID=39947 RepID=I7HDC0_ORYSJ|nr:hypothetical protein [Oryza sativa Japonica Group]